MVHSSLSPIDHPSHFLCTSSASHHDRDCLTLTHSLSLSSLRLLSCWIFSRFPLLVCACCSKLRLKPATSHI
jgi:hypothetical protein